MRRVLKILKYLFFAWLALSAVLIPLNWQNIRMVATYNPLIFPPKLPTPANEAEARAQDLTYLRKLLDYDRSFSEEARVSFLNAIDALETRIETLSDAEFYFGISKAVALADNGHTTISTRPLYSAFNGIDAKLYWFADGLFVVRAGADYQDIVGSRVVAIENTPIADVVTTLSAYRGGPPQWRKLFMPLMMEAPAIMHAAGLAAQPDKITMTLASPEEGEREITFTAQDRTPETTPRRRTWMTLKPQRLADETADWRLALEREAGTAPLYLRNADDAFFEPLPNNGHYIRTRSGFGTKEQSVQDFFKSALAGIEEGALDYLVVDYRLNGGGDYTRSIDFAKTAGQKVKEGGKLYLLVGTETFSASIVTVSMLKYYGGEKSVIVGSPMGDRAQFWAERGMSFQLPNAQYQIYYATGYHDWSKGCTGHPYCFTLNVRHEVPAGSLAPTKMIEASFADYASGRDVVLDWVLAEQASRP